MHVRDYYKVSHYFELNDAIEIIRKDIEANLSEHDIFTILELANEYSLDKITDICLRELLNEDYEPFNYNQFDLLNASEDVFRMVISHHNKSRAEGKTKGFTWEQVEEIIRLYCGNKKLTAQKAARLLQELVDHKTLYQEQLAREKGIPIPDYNPTSEIIASRMQSNLSMQGKMTESMIDDSSLT